MKTTFRKLMLALVASAGIGSAQAGVLSYQDVVFTTTWANNILTLDIDAATHTGDWTKATMLGALGIKGIGQFDSVSLAAAPSGAGAWELSSLELNAHGCSGGGGKSPDTQALCLSGGPIRLADNMVFAFAFTGEPDLDEPHLKVNFLDSRGKKTGDLVSLAIPASFPVVELPDEIDEVPEPQSAALMFAGLALIGLVLRKRR